MLLFKGPFRVNSLSAFLKCPRAFYFKHVMGLGQDRINLNLLAGHAARAAVNRAHREKNWDEDEIYEIFLGVFEKEKAGQKAEIHGAVDLDEYRVMLRAYACQPYNREARVLALDSRFYFEIKPARTTYHFEGRIDQLLQVETDLLRAEFPDVFKSVKKSSIILHRCIKFGQRRQTSPFELALNIQLDILALALKTGIFNYPLGAIDRRSYQTPYFWNIIPDFHAVYFLRDHIPYKDDGGSYLKDESGNFIPCDLVSEPCLLGKKQQPCKGKRTYCTKQPRGPGMFFTTRSETRTHTIPRELMSVCAAIRMGHYPRQPGELCSNYCEFRFTCETEVRSDVEAA
ncbi:MAG: PD-(D/E)XK nuclease family protein [Deltaproteobacteria bacterium]|nr:PD-(D/E)XK nuclease family protein [Deltaproteobacteria bacterium]MBW2086422.1 PD-(D/E)XK nuclease family protein [Deltaproteobacteria bacterium]